MAMCLSIFFGLYIVYGTVRTVLNMAKLKDILLAMQINITKDIVNNRRQ